MNVWNQWRKKEVRPTEYVTAATPIAALLEPYRLITKKRMRRMPKRAEREAAVK